MKKDQLNQWELDMDLALLFSFKIFKQGISLYFFKNLKEW